TFDGSVIVMGDVNAGAEIVATGDVLVFGNLRGIVHAGARGDEEARVCAWRLQPVQLRIGRLIARPPDGAAEEALVPEMASVSEGRVVIERVARLEEGRTARG
ncbi:Septum formation inhibitor MinC, partial [mine drainage metagenome]